jgi:16S rRNA (cytidine1402-2'-O)-methyltransferase
MKNYSSGLYVVSTPIGNLDDITIRSIDVLKKSDIILCEDTRRSLKLLNHLKIKKKLISIHKFNEKKQVNKVIEYLNEGKILSLISDAGTPVLSDPGNLLIKECIYKKIKIFPIPGASSITAAVSVSGFEDQFIFYGFLPKTENELDKSLSKLNEINYSLVFFISGVKIDFYLNSFKKYFSDRQIMIAREITKLHETYYRGDIKSIKLFKSSLKGELTIVISKKDSKNIVINETDIKLQAKIYLKKYSLKDVVELISKKENVPKKKVYKICLEIKDEKNI